MEVTLALPDELLQRVGTVAKRSGRKVEEVLSDAIWLSFAGAGDAAGDDRPWEERSDQEVLACCEQTMEETDDRHLSKLLAAQNAGELSAADRGRLMALMQQYEDRLLLKAEALKEAVKRGLKAPLS